MLTKKSYFMRLFLTLILCFLSTICLNNQLFAQKKKVKKFPTDPAEYQDYGGKLSVGLSLPLGAVVRYRLSKRQVLEAGPRLALIIQTNADQTVIEEIYTPFTFGVGYTYFGKPFFIEKKKRKKTKLKLRQHGIYLRHDELFDRVFGLSRPSFGWAMETTKSKHKGRSFLFELGPAYSILHYTTFTNGRKVDTRVHMRMVWNLFIE
jgi:hypothetical protein